MMFPVAKISSDSEEEEEVKESEMDNGNDDEGVNETRKKKIMIRVVFGQRLRTTAIASCSSSSLCCQADECGMDLRMAKKYHQRHKVCDRHSKAAVVLLSGIRQRFCQQCSKFHEISQFDDTKRSCRERLAGHNERRRKTHAGLHSGTTKQMPESPQMNSTSLNATRHPNLGITNL